MKYSLPGFALRRPVGVTMLSLSMLVLGVIAWMSMPLEFLPDVDQPYMGCSIAYPGATPEQVEQQIAIPVEGEFRTIPGLQRIRTISQRDGCYISMGFDLDTDMTLATAEVRDRMERLKLVLPPEADRLVLQRFSSTSFPIMALGVFREKDQQEFIHLVRTIMEPRLRRIEGVADVNVLSPIQEKNILIEFDQNTLRAMNLGLVQVITALRESSLNVSVGELMDGATKYFVRTSGEYRRIEDIANLVVGPNGLRLKEIANVTYNSRDDRAYVSLDNKGGAFMFVIKESEANAVSTCEDVKKELNAIIEDPVFSDVQLRIFFAQSDLISSSLDNLLSAGLYGGAMALLVLFVFLQRIRPTIIVALTIPCSLVIALVFMFFWGMSLNIVTMVSMIIVIGMLVDNAIVVVENTIRYRQLGFGGVESAERGAAEVSLAIFAATVTTWVVFVPIFYMDAGQMSVLMAQLGLPLIVALGGSLLIALTLIPMAMSRMKDPRHSNFFEWFGHLLGRGHEGTGLARRLRPVQWIVGAYAWLLGLTLRWRLAGILLLAGMIYATQAIPMKNVSMAELVDLDMREMRINVEMDQNFDFPMAGDVMNQLETEISKRREELGIKNLMKFYASGQGWIHVYLYTSDDGPEWENPPYSTEDVMKFLREYLPRRVPGAELKFERADTGTSGSTGTVSIRMRGDDTRLLEEYANRFRAIMANIEHLSDVETDVERSKQEMQLQIDAALAGRAGVSPTVIAQTVYVALGGTRLPYMKQGGREIPVWAQFREEDRKSKNNLDNVSVVSNSGNLVALSELVDYTKERSPSSIHRVDGKNVVTLTAKADNEHLSDIYRDLHAAAGAFELPVGYSIELGDELTQLSKDAVSFGSTLTMAIVLIYIVMSALFESILLPLSILTSVPMALGGAMWMLYLTGSQLDTVTFIGCILMAGLIVNNGIVIVDHINTIRRERGGGVRIFGSELRAAIVQAGRDRFRPVMMTALTTILGVVPLAMANTGGAATFAGLGRALIGGLTAGTILTLFVVPLFYSLIEDFHRWVLDYFGSLSRILPRKSFTVN